jgi:hypothetical protein
VSGTGIEQPPTAKRKDPLVRFLAGCGIAAFVLVAAVLAVGLLIGWQLSRDEAPGRPVEPFLVGDESRFWRLDLKPDDAGLKALFTRLDEINETTRRRIFQGTFLESIPFPHRRARLDELAPFTLEIALAGDGATPGATETPGWAARGTFSHSVLRMRAALKVMGWVLTRKFDEGGTLDVSGVTVTQIRDDHGKLAFATVGNRVIVTSDADRMRSALRPASSAPQATPEPLDALHRQLRLEGEDGWAFLSHARIGDWSKPLTVSGAASFDLNDRDELVFRMIATPDALGGEGNGFKGTREETAAVFAAFLPALPFDAVELDGNGPVHQEPEKLELSGRIPRLSTQLADLLPRTTGLRPRKDRHPEPGPERPAATPTPSSPPPP